MGISCVLRPLSLIQASDRSHIIPSFSLTDLLSCGLPHALPLLTMRSTALPHKMDARYNTHLSASSTQDYMRSPQSPYNKSPIGISPITHIVDLYLSFRFLALLTSSSLQPLIPTFFFSQSSSTFNCPICWYNDARNSSSFLASCTFFIENIRGISSVTCFFHCAICVGCTPYCPAISFAVFSPFIASFVQQSPPFFDLEILQIFLILENFFFPLFCYIIANLLLNFTHSIT